MARIICVTNCSRIGTSLAGEIQNRMPQYLTHKDSATAPGFSSQWQIMFRSERGIDGKKGLVAARREGRAPSTKVEGFHPLSDYTVFAKGAAQPNSSAGNVNATSRLSEIQMMRCTCS